MYRLTTPLQTFKFTTNTNLFEEIVITYAQGGRKIVEKRKDDLSFRTVVESGVTYYIAYFSFTQKETKRFKAEVTGEVQVRVLTTTGQAWASKMFDFQINEVLNSEILESDSEVE